MTNGEWQNAPPKWEESKRIKKRDTKYWLVVGIVYVILVALVVLLFRSLPTPLLGAAVLIVTVVYIMIVAKVTAVTLLLQRLVGSG